MKVWNTFKATILLATLTGLFRTHPHTTERIKRLQAMARPEALWAAGVR